MTLSDLPNWPVKNDIEAAEKELECDSVELNQMIGWNAGVDACDFILECDVEAMAMLLYERQVQEGNLGWIIWKELTETYKNKWRGEAKYVCAQLPKFLKLEKRV